MEFNEENKNNALEKFKARMDEFTAKNKSCKTPGETRKALKEYVLSISNAVKKDLPLPYYSLEEIATTYLGYDQTGTFWMLGVMVENCFSKDCDVRDYLEEFEILVSKTAKEIGNERFEAPGLAESIAKIAAISLCVWSVADFMFSTGINDPKAWEKMSREVIYSHLGGKESNEESAKQFLMFLRMGVDIGVIKEEEIQSVIDEAMAICKSDLERNREDILVLIEKSMADQDNVVEKAIMLLSSLLLVVNSGSAKTDSLEIVVRGLNEILRNSMNPENLESLLGGE